MRPKVVIEVSGGCVQAVYSECECDIVLIDWDNSDSISGPEAEFFALNEKSELSEEALSALNKLESEQK